MKIKFQWGEDEPFFLPSYVLILKQPVVVNRPYGCLPLIKVKPVHLVTEYDNDVEMVFKNTYLFN